MIQFPEQVKVLKREGNRVSFELSPLMPGYGATIANPLRRVLLSSLRGSSITSLKIKGVDHQFSPISGVLEDVMQLILNIKKIRVKSFSDDPVVITLKAKGEKVLTAEDIDASSDVEILTPDQYIATITDKKTELDIEMTIERGIGYIPMEQRQKEKLPIGVIALDAIFSPVKSVNFSVEDIRVGERIDFNRVVMEIETDGSMTADEALKQAGDILQNHFAIIGQLEIPEVESKAKKAKKK